MTVKILHQYHNNMYDTVKALEGQYEVEFLSYRTSQLVPGIKNRKPATGRFLFPYYRWKSLNRLLQNTDILLLKHINDPINLVPYLLCFLKKIRCVIITQRIAHKQFFGYSFFLAILFRILNYFGVSVVATTQESYRELAPNIKKIKYIPVCINPDAWQAQQLKPEKNKLRILTVAKYQPRKNIPLLLESIAELKTLYPSITFNVTILGDLPPHAENKAEYHRIEKIIQTKHLEQNVSLLHDLAYEDMPNQYATCDLFILPAASEPLGYAIVEAMAAGKAVISTDETGASSYIAEDHNGYITKTGSRESLQEKISSFITNNEVDTEKIITFGNASRSIIMEFHSPVIFLRSFNALVA